MLRFRALSEFAAQAGGGQKRSVETRAQGIGGWALAYFVHDSIFQTILVLCVISFGTTIHFALRPTILSQAVPQERTSEVSGMLAVTQSLFSGFGAMMVTVLLATTIVQDKASKAQYAAADAFNFNVLVVIAFIIAATLCAFALP